MFLSSGEETAPVDVMHHIWTGAWPANRCPRLEGTWLDGKTAPQNVRLEPGQTYSRQSIGQRTRTMIRLLIRWEVMHESTETKIGGDAESKPAPLPGLIADPAASEISLQGSGQTRRLSSVRLRF